ncbi:MAG TPA: VCBS repeat-containing protein [Methylomirabilota bacterium]|nr:VCBS repeat-containing protein [Methylomirabilota bacterium]
MSRVRVLLAIGAVAVALPVLAQMPQLPPVPAPQPTPTPTAEAVGEDAAPSPAVAKRRPQTWEEVIADWLTPRPVAKSIAIRIDDKHAYPHAAASIKMEIVKEDEDTLWLRGIPPEDPESPLHQMWSQRQSEERILKQRFEWEQEHGPFNYYLDYGAEIVPPPFVDSLELEEHSTGLPNEGLWQMNFVRDDMDGDGIDDLVFPPTRKGVGQPSIYKGLPEAGFRLWREAAWLRGIPYDYGGVCTGDFDGDGHRDIVLAIHFKQQYILYGDGNGAFPRSERLQAPDPRLTSRACTVADFNGDGRDDIAFIAEIDYDLGGQSRVVDAPTMWVQLKTDDGWSYANDGLPIVLISDDIESVDVDRDGRVDLVVGSNTADWRKLVFLNRPEGWHSEISFGVLSNAYHFDVEPRLRDDGVVEVYAAFMQYNIVGGKNQGRTGLIRYEWTDDGLVAPDGPIYFDDDRTNPYVRLGLGDVNGDGRLDVVAGRKLGGLELWLGAEAGGFVLESSPEFGRLGRAFDIQLVDMNGDGRDDVLASFAAAEGSPGGVRLWLAGGSRE